MASIFLLETDIGTNVNIASATGTAFYTSDGAKRILCDVSLYGVAGNGDYVMYATRRISGTASANIILPKTTMSAASGEINIGGQSVWISVGNGDIVGVYIDGLAGDTSVTGVYTRWWSDVETVDANVIEWLGTAVATPTVSGVPEVDLTMINGVIQSATDLKDFADDGYDPATNKVQGVVLVDTTTTVSGSVNSVATDVGITQAGADKVWTSAARTLTSFGTLVADITTAIFGYTVEGAVTFLQWIRRSAAVLFGKASGGGVAGSKKFRNLGDTVDRVDATTDANGNRTNVTYDDT